MPISPDRPRLRARLQRWLERPGPTLAVVAGDDRPGLTDLVGRVAPPRALRFHATRLTDSDQRTLFRQRLERWFEEGEATDGSGDTWPRLLARIRAHLEASRRPLVLTLENVDLLTDATARFLPALDGFWKDARRRSLPVHLLVTCPPRTANAFRDETESLSRSLDLAIELPPLDFRHVATLFPEASTRSRITAWAALGGSSERVALCDPARSIEDNLRRLYFGPDAPLLRLGFDLLEPELQNARRYLRLTRALSGGPCTWKDLVVRAELERGTQMGPYLARLSDLGVVRVMRSLDAAPTSRRRRYALADAGVAFWHRFVLPFTSEILEGRGGDLWREHVAGRLDEHVAWTLGFACRDYLREYGDEVLPARARVTGGLWGPGYDIDVAAILRNGAALYGRTRWASRPADLEADDELSRQVRSTRFGYGRQARVRCMFADSFTTPLRRRSAASDALVLLDFDALLSGGGTH